MSEQDKDENFIEAQAERNREAYEHMLASAQSGMDPQQVLTTLTKGYSEIMPQLQKKVMARLETSFAEKDLPPELKTMLDGLLSQTIGNAFTSAADIFKDNPLKVDTPSDSAPSDEAKPEDDQPSIVTSFTPFFEPNDDKSTSE